MNRAPFVILILLAVAGCTDSSGKKILVVYSPHGKEMLGEFERDYEALYPDVDVQWLDMGSQDVYDRIRTERHNPQADLWWGAPSTVFARAEAESLLEQYRPSWDSAVAPEFKSMHGFWYGTYLTPEVIMYNNRLVTGDRIPMDWDDLLRPEWKDKIIVRYPLASGTMRIIFCALIQREKHRTGSEEAGFDWLRRLDANTKTYAADPTQLYLKIAREEGLVSLWNLPDVVYQATVNGYPFGHVFPASGTPLITDCIAIVRGTNHRKEAIRALELLTAPDRLLRDAHVYYRIPARTDIPRTELPEWITTMQLTPMPLDWLEIEAKEKQWMKKWDEQVKGRGR